MSSIEAEAAVATTPPGKDAGAAAGLPLTRYQERQAELEYRLLVLVDQLRARIAVVAAELGLTPQQAMLLRHLGAPRTMGAVAQLLACDRSNVTGLIDRMAARGWVQRAANPSDRRIKYLVLTPEGRALRSALQERLFADSPAIAGLEPSERWQLLQLLRKVTPEVEEAETQLGSLSPLPLGVENPKLTSQKPHKMGLRTTH